MYALDVMAPSLPRTNLRISTGRLPDSRQDSHTHSSLIENYKSTIELGLKENFKIYKPNITKFTLQMSSISYKRFISFNQKSLVYNSQLPLSKPVKENNLG